MQGADRSSVKAGDSEGGICVFSSFLAAFEAVVLKLAPF